MGLVTASSEVADVGTITSEGTDVLEMSANRSGSGTSVVGEVVGNSVSSGIGVVEDGTVATVVGATVGSTDGIVVATGPSDRLGASTGAQTLAAHKDVRNTKTTSHRPRCRNDCDFTFSPQGTVSAQPALDGARLVDPAICPAQGSV